jgi:hypothetical protein
MVDMLTATLLYIVMSNLLGEVQWEKCLSVFTLSFGISLKTQEMSLAVRCIVWIYKTDEVVNSGGGEENVCIRTLIICYNNKNVWAHIVDITKNITEK